MTQTPITKSKSRSKILTILAVVCFLAAVAVVSAAVSLSLTAPEHAANTPIDPTPTPTAAPTTSPAPTPVVPTELHLSSNNTTPFYKGSIIQINATLNQPVAGVTIFLKNNGAYLANVNATTNSNGVAVFNRTPMYAFNYTITTIPPS